MEPPPETITYILTSVIRDFGTEQVIGILSMVILLVLSGLVSGSEVAFFSLSPKDLEELSEDEDRTNKLIFDLLDRPKRLLATILITNNFINVAIIILSTMVMSSTFDFSGNEILGYVVQVIVVTFLILLAGEVIPKVYANKNSMTIIHIMAFPIMILSRIMLPFSNLLIRSTRFIDKRMGTKAENISVDELSHALELTSDEETNEDEKKILTGIVKFGNTEVKQIMTSRMDITAIEFDDRFVDVKAHILDSGYSRIPVFRENFDRIEGILYIKDLLSHLDKGNDFKWQSLIRPPFFIPENKKIDDLLKEIQEKKTHIAVVVDEYGGTSGIVTLEDIIEEIVGDITDEFDDDDITYSKLDDDNFIFEGKTPLKDFCRITETDEDMLDKAKGEAESLGGFIVEIAGRIPEKNEEVSFKNLKFVIESADNRKISTVKVIITREEESDER